jgi:hypothetical protein
MRETPRRVVYPSEDPNFYGPWHQRTELKKEARNTFFIPSMVVEPTSLLHTPLGYRMDTICADPRRLKDLLCRWVRSPNIGENFGGNRSWKKKYIQS